MVCFQDKQESVFQCAFDQKHKKEQTKSLISIRLLNMWIKGILLLNLLISLPAHSTLLKIPLYIAGQRTAYSIVYSVKMANNGIPEGQQTVIEIIHVVKSKDAASESGMTELKQQLTHEQQSLMESLLKTTDKIVLQDDGEPRSIWSEVSQSLHAEIFQAADSILSRGSDKTYITDKHHRIELPVIPMFKSTIGQPAEELLFLSRISIKNRLISYAQLQAGSLNNTVSGLSGKTFLAEWEFHLNDDYNFDLININFPNAARNTSWLRSVRRISPRRRGETGSQVLSYNPDITTTASGQSRLCSPIQCSQINFASSAVCIICGGLILSQVLNKQAAPFILGSFVVNGTNIDMTVSAAAIAAAIKTGLVTGTCGLATGLCHGVIGATACMYNMASTLKKRACSHRRYTEEDLIRTISNLRLTPYSIDSCTRYKRQNVDLMTTVVSEQPTSVPYPVNHRSSSTSSSVVNPWSQENGAVCVEIDDSDSETIPLLGVSGAGTNSKKYQ